MIYFKHHKLNYKTPAPVRVTLICQYFSVFMGDWIRHCLQEGNAKTTEAQKYMMR